MRPDERIVVLWAVVRVALPLLLTGAAALSATYYRYGPTPLFFALLLGVPLVLVILTRLIVVRRGARRPSALAGASGDRPRFRRLRRAVASIRRTRHGASSRQSPRQ